MRSDETATSPQLNSVRSEYVTGSLDDTQLETRVEQALEGGPPIGRDGPAVTPPTGFDALTSAIAGMFIVPLIWIESWKGGAEKHAKYDWERHYATFVNRDPDPDSHPAESAGANQKALWLFPLFVSGVAAVAASAAGSVVPTLLLLMVYLALSQAPTPTVEHIHRGLGRHVAHRTEDD